MRSPSVVVIGAGPAGSTAARLLASEGARVVLVEARRLPREKACAGGLTSKALPWIPATVLETSERSVHEFEFHGGRLPPFRLDEPDAEITMVDRAAFDYAMAEAAAAAGVTIHDGERAIRADEAEDGVQVTTRRGSLRAEYLIAADGDPSSTARDLGLGGPASRRSLALSAQVPLATAMSTDTAVIAFTAARGYAWYFPKGSSASVGIGSAIPSDGRRAAIDTMRDELARFAEDAGFSLDGARLTGHWLPQGGRRGRLASRRSMLVGDAAGMADPLFGEGIAYAIASGCMAAQAIHDVVLGRTVGLEPYEARLRAAYGGPMRRLHLATRIVERSPSLALAVARLSPWVQAYGANVVSGRRAPFAVSGLVDVRGSSGIHRGPTA